jgi:hypothetical protein
MIPADLPRRTIRLPPKGICSIVVFTGPDLRHERFALRIQKEFGTLVAGWFQVVRPEPRAPTAGRSRQQEVEERLFGDEVRWLRRGASLQPVMVADPNSPDVIDAVRSLNPYLFLSLGGAIYRRPLLDGVRGVALNQHSGWSPEYKGSNTTDWALYHRDLAHVGNTVHLVTSGIDAGPIVRRSTACITPEDTRESCFARVVALGTDLMCEVVAEIIRSDEIAVHDQPGERGRTYLGAELTDRITCSIDADIAGGWLQSELRRLTQF